MTCKNLKISPISATFNAMQAMRPLDKLQAVRPLNNLQRKVSAMDRLQKLALTILSVVLAILLNILFGSFDIAYATENPSTEETVEQLTDAVNSAIDNLDLDELQEYLNSLSYEQQQATFINDLKTTLKSLISGNSTQFFEEFANLVASTLGKYFLGFLPSFVTIIIICLLNSMLGGMTADFLNKSTTEVTHTVCYSAVVIVLMSGVVSTISVVKGTVDALITFSNALFPPLLTLLSMVGGEVAVATYSPLMAVLCGFIMKIISAVILPAFVAIIVFSVVGNMSKTVKLDKLTKAVKSASTWLIGIVFGVFATFLTAQGITGGVVDKFGFNIAKFALSSYVPVLGGYLSDGFDLLSASLVLVKNALGYTGVVILLCTVLFPLLKIVIFTLVLKFTSAIVEPIGDNRVATLLHSVADSMNLLITALAGVAFMFFLLLMLFIGSCNMGI